MNEEMVQFTTDEKAVLEREIKSAYHALSTLLDWVKNDGLNEEMKESLPYLVDSYMSKVKEVLGFTGKESDRSKEMKKAVMMQYQKRIQELEEALKDTAQISGLSETIKVAFNKVNKWWKEEGFGYISEKAITDNGIMKMELQFSLSNFLYTYSDTPESDKDLLNNKIFELKQKGFQFAPKRNGRELEVLDNDNNRSIIMAMVKEAFPTAKVWEFRNVISNPGSHIILRGVTFGIYDMAEVEAL